MDDALVTDLRGEVGDALRAVGTYDGDDYHVRYLRDDVAPALDDDDLDAIRQGAVFDSLERDYYERLFATAGTFEATVRRFEHAVVVEVPTCHGGGVLASIDRAHDGCVDAVVDRCRAVTA
ncbi:DUF7522 family protein [Halobaculum lipolyticum]|uniref:Uncharacterized protein n=1 Tax=Halobaculum lipolyticum TaxID=3032001 RepID=A0ABD5WCN7_9EURY|nr:hypothetical protein [Halobaculum sp. DT31]